jgi:hypothetical protein
VPSRDTFNQFAIPLLKPQDPADWSSDPVKQDHAIHVARQRLGALGSAFTVQVCPAEDLSECVGRRSLGPSDDTG